MGTDQTGVAPVVEVAQVIDHRIAGIQTIDLDPTLALGRSTTALMTDIRGKMIDMTTGNITKITVNIQAGIKTVRDREIMIIREKIIDLDRTIREVITEVMAIITAIEVARAKITNRIGQDHPQVLETLL